MNSPVYRTNRWLRFALSLAAFGVIGLLVQFDIKGSKEPLLRLIAEQTVKEEPSVAQFAWFAIWTMVAAALGWVLQSFIVVALGRKHEKRKGLP